ncbi:hypothetical protein QQ045_011310 [Rhodiola kirilowii]
MRCLLSRHLLAGGFFPVETSQNDCNSKAAKLSNYSWSGKRRMPSYLSKLVFPEDFLTALRTISMKEEQIFQVSSMLEEKIGNHQKLKFELLYGKLVGILGLFNCWLIFFKQR